MSGINKRAQQQDVEIISNKKVGAYHHIVFAVGDMASYAKPGNFVAISVGGSGSSMILRRAFAIYRASDRGQLNSSSPRTAKEAVGLHLLRFTTM
jgi:dihydroorotate dehydrogenase electron transfer subunit